MKLRAIKNISYAHEFQMGEMRVKQPLPSQVAEQVSPFILLHHAGPMVFEPGAYKTRISPHPHRGFEPVTFLFSGKAHHRDSMGNEGFLNAGGVQWMTAGRGVIHSEGPSEEFAKEGGTLELIQLWINLPREFKMTLPKYQDISLSAIPEIVEDENKIRIRLVAGEYKNIKGPASTFTKITAMMAWFEKDANFYFTFPSSENVMIYLLDGKLKFDHKEIDRLNMIEFENDGEEITFQSTEKGKLLLLAGEPINEPLASYGPFVMNYQGEIKQAILDYEQGKMGSLDF